jgi:hypothetical protein
MADGLLRGWVGLQVGLKVDSAREMTARLGVRLRARRGRGTSEDGTLLQASASSQWLQRGGSVLIWIWSLLWLAVISVVINGTWNPTFGGRYEGGAKVRPMVPVEGILVTHFPVKILDPVSALDIFEPYFLFYRLHWSTIPRFERKMLIGENCTLFDDGQVGRINNVGFAQDIVFRLGRSTVSAKILRAGLFPVLSTVAELSIGLDSLMV